MATTAATLDSDDASILEAHLRLLFVRIAAPLFQLLTIVVHGLDSAYGAAAVGQFWLDKVALARKHRRRGERILLCTDANE